jgi:FKBP-type peptidyl-prolyl cis-trans isomerase 2
MKIVRLEGLLNTDAPAAECVNRCKGLNLAVATMRVGETCNLRISPEYGYGSKGSFSFPSVPPNASLEYTVTLLGFSLAAEKEVGRMFFEERVDAAHRTRIKVLRPSYMHI